VFQKIRINYQINSLIKRLVLGALFLVMPMLVQALGLGNARVLSKLNEPLNVELEILANNPKELQSLLPNLADLQDFERAGIERPDYLTTVQFKVENRTGKPIIRLTTIDAVKEPVVNLLIELTGSQGRILKEYTVLLDPPEFSKKTPPEAQLQPQLMQGNNTVFDAFEEKMPTVSTNQSPAAQKATLQPDQNLQLRMSKVEAQLTELTNQKQHLEQAKQLLSEENNNLHDLVALKQKEIEMLHTQPAPIQSQRKQASLSHIAKAQMIEPDEENLPDSSSSIFSPWLLLGLILVVTFSSLIALREWFKRKEMAFPFNFSLPKFSFGNKSEGEEWQADFQKNKPQNFQEVVSLLKTSEAEQAVSAPQQAVYKQPTQNPIISQSKNQHSLNQQSAPEQVNIPLLEDADVYITFGKVKMAEEIILKILNHQPNNIKARLKLIDLFSSQSKLAEAQEQFKLLPAHFATDNPDQYAIYQKKFKSNPDTNVPESPIQTEEKNFDIADNVILEPSVELIDSFSATPNTAAGNLVSKTDLTEQDPSVFQTKLDFAKVYMDMQDKQAARDLLNEVIQSGPTDLKEEAQKLLESLK
jgi:FimV-like protein